MPITILLKNTSTLGFSDLPTALALGRSKNPGVISIQFRDVTIGATGAAEVAPKFSDTLTLSQPRGADSAHHYRGYS